MTEDSIDYAITGWESPEMYLQYKYAGQVDVHARPVGAKLTHLANGIYWRRLHLSCCEGIKVSHFSPSLTPTTQRFWK